MLDLEQEFERLRARLYQLERTRSRAVGEWMNETEAVRYVGRHDEYLAGFASKGRGPPGHSVGRQWMRRRTDLDRFMDNPDSFA